MPVYTKASRAARRESNDAYDLDEDDQDFTLLWRGPSSMPPPSSRPSAPPPSSRPSAPPHARRERVSSAPAPRSERPPPQAARVTPPPPPSVPTPPRAEMRADAALAQPDPPRLLELTVHERRWKIVIRASLLLSIGCIIGIGTEVLIKQRGAEVVPDPSTTSATFALEGSSVSISTPPAPTPTQCMTASIAPSPLPSFGNEGASIAHAVHHHRHHDHASDAPQGTPSAESARPAAAPAEPILPDDIAAAAAEALSKAQQETMLP